MKTLKLTLFLCWNIISISTLFAQNEPFIIGEEVKLHIATEHPYSTEVKGYVFEKKFYSKGSSYIKIHLKNFDLGEGDYIEIYSPNTKEQVIYAGSGIFIDESRSTTISDFWTQSIFDDQAILRLYSTKKSSNYGFDIESVAYGFPESQILDLMNRAICGNDDKDPIYCHEGTEMYMKGRAVCGAVIKGTGMCTGWLLGKEGHVMTNNHCIGTNNAALTTEFRFNYQYDDCGESIKSTIDVVATTSTLICNDGTNDYALVKLPVNPTDKYGYLSFRSTPPTVGERIYIPQHPGQRRKEIAVKDDQSGTGLAAINGTGNRVTYKTDTEPGSSGSPVLSYEDNLVVVLHNTGGCNNGGNRNNNIITHMGDCMPDGGTDDLGSLVIANFSANVTKSCDGIFTFTDKSSNAITWSWKFGDGGTSSKQSPTHTYVTGGKYIVTLEIDNGKGKKDSKELDVEVTLATPPTAQGVTICGNASANLVATGGGGNLNWYDANTGGKLLGTGGSFTTGILNVNTIFYVEEEEFIKVNNGGAIDNSFNTGAYFDASDVRGLIFDVLKPVTLKSVKVYSDISGDRLIEVQDAVGGNTIASKTVNINEGESRITLDFLLNPGNNYHIKVTGDLINLYRNDGGATFPYNIDNEITITGTDASRDDYYYFFYDWEVQEIGCKSRRTKVEVAVNPNPTPVITRDLSTLTVTNVNGPVSYQWYRDGVIIVGAISNVYEINGNGVYSVEVLGDNGCKGEDSMAVLNTTVLNLSNIALFEVAPNPSNGKIKVSLGLNNPALINLKLYNTIGDEVWQNFANNISGKYSQEIDISNQSTGIYFLRIVVNDEVLIQKIIKE